MTRLTAPSDLRALARGWRWTRRPLTPGAVTALARADREFPTGWARHPAAGAVRQVIARAGLAPLLAAEVRQEVAGLDVLSGLTGPVLFLANHASHLDTALVLAALPERWRRQTAVAAAADYFFESWWRAVGSALAFNTFPLNRRGGATSTSTATELVATGWNVLLFPEGSRSADGWLGRMRPGAAWLATGQRLPVVPVAVSGTFAAMPRGRAWPVPGRPRVGVRFGPAVHPAPGEAPRDLAVRLQAALERLLEEDATDWWSSLQRHPRELGSAGTGPAGAAPWRRRWAATAPRPAPGPPSPWR